MIKIELPNFSLDFNIEEIASYREELKLFPGGVYFLCDKSSKYLYIGKSKNLYRRILEHRRAEFSKEIDTVKIIFEDNPSYRDILETYSIMKFEPKYNIDKIFVNNNGDKVRDILSDLYESKYDLELRLSDLRLMRDDLISVITPPTVQSSQGYFGNESEVESRRFNDSLSALLIHRENYDIEDEYELREIVKELKDVENELSRVCADIRSYSESLQV